MQLFSNRINLMDYLKLRDDRSIAEVYDTPGTLVNLLVSNLFVITGVIIFAMIIGAGFSFMQDTDKGKSDAKTLLTGAVAGFAIMFSAYWIIQIIKAVTGADIPI